jgi:tRNA G18 (ribose-2'-O)-methylase SpoU
MEKDIKEIVKLSMDELNRKSVAEFKEAEKFPIVVVLENIRSAYNVGSVFRTADAFLLQSIYIVGYTALPPHKEIKKTALGAEDTVQWKHFKNISQAIDELRGEGFKIYAVEQAQGSIMLQAFEPGKDKIAVIFGNEVSGVEQSTIELVDGCIEIPQLGMKHSLNISVAAGIVLWEVVRKKLNEAAVSFTV